MSYFHNQNIYLPSSTIEEKFVDLHRALPGNINGGKTPRYPENWEGNACRRRVGWPLSTRWASVTHHKCLRIFILERQPIVRGSNERSRYCRTFRACSTGLYRSHALSHHKTWPVETLQLFLTILGVQVYSVRLNVDIEHYARPDPPSWRQKLQVS